MQSQNPQHGLLFPKWHHGDPVTASSPGHGPAMFGFRTRAAAAVAWLSQSISDPGAAVTTTTLDQVHQRMVER